MWCGPRRASHKKVVELKLSEMPGIKSDVLLALQQEMGVRNSQQIIERAAFELSDRLWIINTSLNEGDIEHLRRLAASLVSISRQIGLEQFAKVAAELVQCIKANDHVAMHAVCARLQRIGEVSLHLVVKFRENSQQ